MTTIAPTRPRSHSHEAGAVSHRWCRRLLFAMLGHLEHGQLHVIEPAGHTTFGSDSSLQATITIKHPAAFAKLLLGGSVGAAEAYIDGFWEADDLTRVVRIMVLNLDVLEGIERRFSWLLRPSRFLQHLLNSNSKEGAKQNILAHYDLSNDLYKTFLDPTMMYSSAIYPEPDSSLETAAVHKLDHICRKLELGETDRVLEIGSGWGGFAIHAASRYGCHVTTTTISKAQYEEAKQRIEAAGLSHKITLLQQDYRDLSGRYDKLVSIEMIEAVGYRYLPLFFKKCGSLLKADGAMLLQAITMVDQKYKKYLADVDFIQKYIFPGGCLTANHHMQQLIAARTDLVVRHLEDFGFDYARTLKDWRNRFHSAFPTIQHLGFDERFKRLWEYYLSYCEGGFLERSISVVQLLATRPRNRQDLARL